MRLRSFAALLVSAFLLMMAGGPTAVAQNDPLTRFLNSIFQPREVQPPPPTQRQRPAPRPAPRRTPPPAVVRETPQKPKIEASNFIVVLGDSLADLLAQGLGEAFAEAPEIAVTVRARADSGLVRADFYDWPKAVRDLLASPQRITVGVMMIGANDRQALRDGETSVEPGAPRWKELYAARVDAIVSAFAERKLPLVWVGLPPMKNERLTADLLAFNELYRERVEKAGGIYVDIWEAFVDAENRYAATGPDVTGQTARLRTADGVHFTKAGARKAAHFVEVEIRRLLQGQAPAIVALPEATEEQGPRVRDPIERMIDASIPALPEPHGLLSIPTKPLAGPILPLTRIDTTPGGTLSNARPRLTGEAGALIERVYGLGQAPDPRPGRADDFRWPRDGL
ncbi:SGNH family hydrolase [Chelatococcus sp. SYSU_G07232]|uniref:SGNH family hydrolase n=1 Tax=Chelatococcus albus TaxID=3047466 RepID=A0ABT7AG30_9HYPH|nr:SGNH family hydrolase [Chelatococcus sp. SYSU_G07232]MDJ1158314.1 SGNH family hydrolase [Chelatococcus sp. SYSU_G07232]